ncbi:type II-A CRISPR-associated protein Csn2 [Latilactobacillus curvatus]|uniref:type II-A CRISPR-associated protein Csn2 n=1 Tax=Latilactobacillus curvatus TaxID=28038 RepID=UPI0039081792
MVQTAVELNESKIITLINVSHYLSINQFNELVRLVATLNVKLFLIEFSEEVKSDQYQKCYYYHIDNDYVEWRYE